MAKALSVFRAQVDYLIAANEDELSWEAREEIIKSAFQAYSHDAPNQHTDDVTGDGGNYYPLSGDSKVLADWSEGFSRIVNVEYPAASVADDEVPQYLEAEDWRSDYWASDVRYLYMPNHSPAASEKMRVTYTIPYELAGTPETVAIPDQDFFAVCELAAGMCCQATAAKYARIGDSTIGADSTEHVSKSRNFAARAKAFMESYREHMGLGKDAGEGPAGEFVDWDTEPGWPAGRRYVFHGDG